MCHKIRCDGECEKIYKLFWELNKAYYVYEKNISILFNNNYEK
jgi:hypothetical protein